MRQNTAAACIEAVIFFGFLMFARRPPWFRP
jgi:hypothetical protein